MTATPAPAFMIQRYDLEGAASVLENEGLLLLPTDALWCVACLADNPVSLARFNRLKNKQRDQQPEILFSSLDMLKRYAPKLHPRLETLLAYHLRPLTVITEANNRIRPQARLADGRIAARIVRDQYCRNLIQLLGRPVVTTIAHFTGSPYPDHFGRIRSDIIEAVDYVAKYRPKDPTTGRPTIMVQLDEQEELDFLRD